MLGKSNINKRTYDRVVSKTATDNRIVRCRSQCNRKKINNSNIQIRRNKNTKLCKILLLILPSRIFVYGIPMYTPLTRMFTSVSEVSRYYVF